MTRGCMRKFLWVGAVDKHKDHLVTWVVCWRFKIYGGLGIGILYRKIHLYWQNGVDIFRRNQAPCGTG